MKWNIYKIIQLGCWCISMIVLISSLLYPELFGEKQDIYLELLAGFSGAAIAVGEFSEQRTKKFSTANVLAIGYISNCIEPIMEEQLRSYQQQGKTFSIRKIIILIPQKLTMLNSATLNAMLATEGIITKKVSVPVSMRNRTTMDIQEFKNEQTHEIFYFDTPNTLSSLNALIDYKLNKKGNTVSNEKKVELEKKYLSIFRSETQRILEEMNLVNYVKLIDNISQLK